MSRKPCPVVPNVVSKRSIEQVGLDADLESINSRTKQVMVPNVTAMYEAGMSPSTHLFCAASDQMAVTSRDV